MCKLTGFRLASVVNSGRRHVYVKDLHYKYGSIVRTGPNTLSASSTSAVAAIYAASTAFPKSKAYSDLRGGLKGIGMFTMRTKEEHGPRRRTWAAAFSNQAMDRYQAGIERRTNQLLKLIPRRADTNGVVNLSTCISHWAFDVLSDITSACPRELEMMEKGDTIGFLSKSQEASKYFEIFSEVPWLLDLLSLVPGIGRTNPMNVPEAYARQFILNRANHTCSDHNDLASYLLGERGLTGESLGMDDLVVDTLLALQAGADTVSTTLVLLLYYVLSDSTVYKRVRQELDANFGCESEPSKPMTEKTLSELPYLSAILEESFRLGSPFHAVPRQVPEGGAIVDGMFVPEGTVISVTSPERWLPGGLAGESCTNKAAILTFSAGTFGCLGKNLAKRMIRYCAARILKGIDIQLTPAFDGRQFIEGISHVRATIFKHPLTVVASPRS
ncbi:cytochrome P450 [Irpex lacteus]|nr:cytochrome P450 [Irpex lacteus]